MFTLLNGKSYIHNFKIIDSIDIKSLYLSKYGKLTINSPVSRYNLVNLKARRILYLYNTDYEEESDKLSSELFKGLLNENRYIHRIKYASMDDYNFIEDLDKIREYRSCIRKWIAISLMISFVRANINNRLVTSIISITKYFLRLI
jgi:hypothetical protein